MLNLEDEQNTALRAQLVNAVLEHTLEGTTPVRRALK